MKGEHRTDLHGSQAKALVKHHIRKVMMMVASQPLFLADVVAGGFENWRQTVELAFHPYPLPPTAATDMFRFFSVKLVEEFGSLIDENAQVVDAAVLAAKVLDNVEPVSGPSNAEVDAAWAIEDFSSEGAKRQYAEEHGMPVQEHLAKLIQIDRDKANANATTVH